MPPTQSIPTSPPPDKDPPSPSPSQTAAPTPTPTSNLPTSPQKQPSTTRPSPLRQTTSSSLLPTNSTFQQPTSTIGTSTLHPPDEQPPERPPLTPFFTLIHDPATNTTHHPSKTHYLFLDDDDPSDALSAACIRSLHPASTSPSRSPSPGKSTSPIKPLSSSTTSSGSSKSGTHKRGSKGKEDDRRRQKEGERRGQREERVIIIDVNEFGTGITQATSLSANWQILSASLSSAPMFSSGPSNPPIGEEEEEGEGRGLMLRIEGTGIDTSDERGREGEGLGIGEKKGGSGVLGEEEMQSLLEGFDRKMGILRKIVGEGWGGFGVGMAAEGNEAGIMEEE